MARKRRGRGEGSVFYSEAKGVWIGRVVGLTGKREEVTAQTKGEVLARLRQLGNTPGGETKKMTVGTYLPQWLVTAEGTVAPTTYQTYRRYVETHLVPRLGKVLLANLGAAHVEALYNGMLKEEFAPATAAKAGRVLGTAISHALVLKLIASDPVRLVRKPRLPQECPEVFEADEVRLILKAAAGRRVGAIIVVGVATGARQGELLALEWRDIDFEKATLSVARALADVRGKLSVKEPKTKRGNRTIALPPFALDALHQRRLRAVKEGNGAAPVFCTAAGKWLARAVLIRRVWRPALAKAQVRYRNFHVLRHTAASTLLAQGFSLNDVSARLGDDPATIARVYAHLMQDQGAEMAERLGRLYG